MASKFKDLQRLTYALGRRRGISVTIRKPTTITPDYTVGETDITYDEFIVKNVVITPVSENQKEFRAKAMGVVNVYDAQAIVRTTEALTQDCELVIENRPASIVSLETLPGGAGYLLLLKWARNMGDVS